MIFVLSHVFYGFQVEWWYEGLLGSYFVEFGRVRPYLCFGAVGKAYRRVPFCFFLGFVVLH